MSKNSGYGRRRFIKQAVAASAVMASPAWMPGAWQQAVASNGTPTRGGVLVATWGGLEPQALFVPGGGGSSPYQTSTKILERLLRLTQDLRFEPVLAQSVEPSADFRTYTITLRQGVKWHDGKPVTADDLVYNFTEHWRKISAGVALKALDGVDRVDDLTVNVRFTQPLPEFFFKSTLAGKFQLLLPKHLYEGKDILTNPLNNTPVGTGPWKYKEWVRGSHVEYAANPDYWDAGKPYLDKLIVRWWSDPSARAAALETGELGLAFSSPVPGREIDRLVKTGKVQVDTRGYENGAWTVTLEFNQRRPIVQRRDVRQAILHAIDRQLIIDTIYFGRGKPAVSPVLSNNKLFFSDDVKQYPYDPALARRLLDEAGLPDKKGGRFQINLVAAAWFEENAKLGQYLKQALEDVGIAVRLDSADRATALKRIYGDYDYDLAVSNFTSTIELVPTVTQFFTSDGIIKGAAFRNASGYSNPELDKVVERLTLETDPEKRKALAHTFARITTEDAPLVPLVEIEAFTLHGKNVRGYLNGADVHGEALSETWLAR